MTHPGNGKRLTLPQSIEAEQGIVCSFLLSPDRVAAICAQKNLHAGHFHDASLATVYDELKFQHEDREPIDLLTFTQHLHDQSKLADLRGNISGSPSSGVAFITELYA